MIVFERLSAFFSGSFVEMYHVPLAQHTCGCAPSQTTYRTLHGTSLAKVYMFAASKDRESKNKFKLYMCLRVTEYSIQNTNTKQILPL